MDCCCVSETIFPPKIEHKSAEAMVDPAPITDGI
jgi:hypothetical protein